METARLKTRLAMRMRQLLPCVLLLLLAPFAQAHVSHDTGHEGTRAAQLALAELASAEFASAEVASATAPCRDHGTGSCCCTNVCCYSPNLVKLPAIQASSLYRTHPSLPSAHSFVSIQAPRAVSPIIASAAPRAPPLPL